MIAKALPALALVATAASLAFREHWVLINDNAAWLLQGGVVLLDGGVLYRDYMEHNPPLVVYLHAPVVALANMLGASLHLAFLGAVHAVALASFALCLPVLARLGEASALLFLYLILVYPGSDFGEREHLMVLFAAPWMLAQAEEYGSRPRLLLLALPGLLLKPHFLVVPAALWLHALARGRGRALFPDMVLIAAASGAYVLFIASMHPLYLTEIVPMARKYYLPTIDLERLGAGVMFSGAAVSLMLAALVREAKGFRAPLAVASLAFLAAAAAQGRGGSYHILPAAIFGFLAFGSGMGAPAWKPAAAVAAGFLAFWPAFLVKATGAWRPAYEAIPLVQTLKRDHAGKSLVILTTDFSTAFPLVAYTETRWASRYNAFDMLYLALKREAFDHAHPKKLVQGVIEDIRERKPDLVLLKDQSVTDASGAERTLESYLRGFPEFAGAMSGYVAAGRISRYAVLAAKKP